MSTAMLAGVMALAACSGDGEDPAPPIDPTDAVTDNGPTEDPATVPPEDLPEPLADLVSEPVYPDAATEFTPDGAEAFVHYVMDAANWAYATGDASHLLDYCNEESGYCSSVTENAVAVANGFITRYGGLLEPTIHEIEIYPEHSDAFVSTTVNVSAYKDVDESGQITTEFDDRVLEVTFQASFDAGKWHLLLAGGE